MTTSFRTSLKAALALLVAAAAACIATASASAHGSVPYHELGQVSCSQGLVRVNPPRIMRSWHHRPDFRNPELVHWSPDLYVYTAAGWRLVDGSRPWYRAFTTSSIGFYQQPYVGAWQDTRTNNGVMFVPYSGLGSGHYRIKNFLHWSSTGVKHVEWSGYCYVP